MRMDMNKANEISSAQVLIFVITAQISFGILSLGSKLAEKVGHDGWISILLSGALVCILIYFLMSLLNRFQTLSLLDINVILFGKIIGGFINWFLIAKLIYTSIMSLRLFVDIIKVSTLEFTPAYALSIFVMLPVVYLSWYGLKYICRFSSLMPVLLIIIVLYYFLLSKYFRNTFLQPIGTAGLVPIIKSSYIPYLSFIGFEMLGIIFPHIKHKKQALRFALYGNLITISFYVITVVFITGFFGEEMLKQLQYPIFSLARAYRAPILERLDLFFIALWFPIMETAVIMFFFNGFYSIRKILDLENNRIKSKILIFVYTTIIIILSWLPKDSIQVAKLFNIIGYMNTAFILHILLCYCISFFISGGKKSEKAV